MKNTLRLFQLLLAVYGFYVVVHDSANPQPLIALACIVLIVILDRFQTMIIDIDARQKAPVASRVDQGARVKQQLEVLPLSRSTAVVSNAILELIRDLGLTIRPSRQHQVVDYLLELPGPAGQTVPGGANKGGPGRMGLKIIHDVNEPDQNWPQWQQIKEFEEEGNGQHHFLLIAHNLAEDPKTGPPSYVNFSAPVAQLLGQHGVTAMTSLSFCHLYQLCKKSSQDPQQFFQRICQHQGGVLEI